MDGNPDVVMFGLMSSMRTGNMLFDMCVCLVLPWFFRYAFHYVQLFSAHTRNFINRNTKINYRRTVDHIKSSNPWSDPKTETKNQILQAAIRAYIGKKLKPSYPDGEIKLMAVASKKPGESQTLVQQLESKYSAVTLVQQGVQTEIVPGIWFREILSVEDEKDEKEEKTLNRVSTVTMEFVASRFGGKKLVDNFIQRAFDWYVAEVAKDEDNSRFMYQPLSREKYATAEERNKPRQYKRYQLSNDKTFDSLFFPEKNRLLKLVDQFEAKGGKYAIPGFSHKLGVLLYGPPGTGKTSMCKALAAKTGRHIISVPLGRVHTNQELMDIMFDQIFKCKEGGRRGGDDDDDDDDGGGSGGTGKHEIKDVIFLLEDVDAASDVVLSRERRAIKKKMAEADGGDGAGDQKGNDLMTAMMVAQMQLATMSLGNDVAAGGDSKDEPGGDKKDGKTGSDWSSSDKDKLSLAGLLNVLDGVVDSPGRILIMTTNHRDRLDPALLRPGRINLQIKMDYIQSDSVKGMVKHYYPKATEKELDEARRIFKERQDTQDFCMSPAEMEQVCAENNTLEELYEAIQTTAVPPGRNKGSTFK